MTQYITLTNTYGKPTHVKRTEIVCVTPLTRGPNVPAHMNTEIILTNGYVFLVLESCNDVLHLLGWLPQRSEITGDDVPMMKKAGPIIDSGWFGDIKPPNPDDHFDPNEP